jgi:hypothetical protein
MITYKGGENSLYIPDSERKYLEDSECNILIFNWERWCFHETDWCTFPNTNTSTVSVGELIEEIKEYDICFFVISEMIVQNLLFHASINDNLPTIDTLFEEMSKLNVVYLCLSEDSNFPIDKSKSLNMPWFTDKKIYISENTTSDFDYRQKDFTFNMLLGSERKHRTKIFESLRHNSYMYSSYMGHAYHVKNSDTHLDTGDIISSLTDQDLSMKLNTMEKIKREDINYCISHIVPETIYNNTHFDIVTESQPKRNGLHFTTEKTGKPIAAGRFFIWYNSPHKVEYLRQFGFELQDYMCGYDQIIDDYDRLDAIFTLVREIGNNENYIKKIYEDTKEARIHNQEVYNKLKKTYHIRLVDWMTSEVNKIL